MIVHRKITSKILMFAAAIAGLISILAVQSTKVALPRRGLAVESELPKLADFYALKTFRPAELSLNKFDKPTDDFVLKITLEAPGHRPDHRDIRPDLAIDLLKKMPSLMPVKGYISSSFGLRSDPFSHKIKHHNGIDIAAKAGSPVFAPADGLVFKATNNKSFGNMVEIMHECGLHTRFGHLDKILVSKGEKVTRGQIIGRVGNTGERSRGPHLHYEVRHENTALDPMNYL